MSKSVEEMRKLYPDELNEKVGLQEVRIPICDHISLFSSTSLQTMTRDDIEWTMLVKKLEVDEEDEEVVGAVNRE